MQQAWRDRGVSGLPSVPVRRGMHDAENAEGPAEVSSMWRRRLRVHRARTWLGVAHTRVSSSAQRSAIVQSSKTRDARATSSRHLGQRGCGAKSSSAAHASHTQRCAQGSSSSRSAAATSARHTQHSRCAGSSGGGDSIGSRGATFAACTPPPPPPSASAAMTTGSCAAPAAAAPQEAGGGGRKLCAPASGGGSDAAPEGGRYGGG
jgi:hypothetical protein